MARQSQATRCDPDESGRTSGMKIARRICGSPKERHILHSITVAMGRGAHHARRQTTFVQVIHLPLAKRYITSSKSRSAVPRATCAGVN